MSAPRLFNPTLYLVTDTRLCGSVAAVAETARRAVAGGVTAVQVRDKHATTTEYVQLARAVIAAVRRENPAVPVLLNDRVHLVSVVGADGAHVGQSDLSPMRAREVLGPAAVLGLTVNAHAHLDALAEVPEGTVDYLGVGPLYPQTTKADAAPVLGHGHIASLMRRSPVPCVAIAGITASRLGEVARTGAAGVAVVSAMCGQPDPALAATELRQAWDVAVAAAGSSARTT